MMIIRKIKPVLLLVLIHILFSSCSGDKGPEGKKDGPVKATVGGLVVTPREMLNTIVATGNVLANEEVELRSETPGRIISINFEEGSFVEKGRMLLKTDDRELQAQLKKLQVEEKQAKDDLFRKEKLLALKAISQEEYDLSFNALGIIQAQIDLIRTQISKTEIIAPFSGKIGLRQVSPGGFVSSSTLVARLQQTDPVKIEFSVPEKYQEKVGNGDAISFTVEGHDSLFRGTIYAIESRVDPATRNIGIRAKCTNRDGMLVPGAFARVRLLLDKFDNALVIPSEAVIPQMNGEKVFVSRDGKAVSQLIKTGIRTEREVQVLEGINPGDTVVTTGLLQLREGASIKVKIQP
jgi:membrane fusion protein (multidrug efflux system)